jgi:ribonucleotide reductase beta subunit family protein with ferritin-like domain
MFIKSRINEVMNMLGYDSIYDIGDNPIAETFYLSASTYKQNDFFSGMNVEYNRNAWDQSGFVWA